MREIRPQLISVPPICEESAAPPCAMVVFGASGDLSQKKLLPSLFALYQKRLLPENFYLLGCGRTALSDEEFRNLCRQAIGEGAGGEMAEEFIGRLYYISGDYDNASFYVEIGRLLENLDNRYNTGGCRVFYLAVPPQMFGSIAENLGHSGLSYSRSENTHRWARLVIEKPFGSDLQSAVELNSRINRHFSESQIYRIDHYLGKETVQNILMFRFANSIFEPIWNRNYIDNMQITIAESIGIEHRAGYYDKAGALRDVFQNHMLQLLALVAMEPPVSFEADSIRDEKVKLLRSIRPFSAERPDGSIVRGQYGAGTADGREVCGYRQEKGIPQDSNTETFVAAQLFIDNWRWKQVPFYLRTGKRLSKRVSHIVITFKKVPHSMFASFGIGDMPPNVLIIEIQPEEGISLAFQAKRPGSKICMSTLAMNFSYSDVFGAEPPDAYERLLLDCMAGDQTLFTRYDDITIEWELLMPVIEYWQKHPQSPYEYPAGSESFPQADQLIQRENRDWQKL